MSKSRRKVKRSIVMVGQMIAIIVIVISIFFAGYFLGGNKYKDKHIDNNIGSITVNDGQKADMSIYSTYDANTEYVYLVSSVNEISQKLNDNETFVFFVSYTTCPWCVEAMPILNEEAKANDMTIDYINVNDMSGDDLARLKEMFMDHLKTDSNGNKVLYTPFAVFIKDGQVQYTHIGTVDSHYAKDRTMTSDEESKLHHIYNQAFKMLK